MSPARLKRLPDERLSLQLAAGRSAAFDELYRRYYHRLAAYAGRLLGDSAAGDDVAQTALLKAYQSLTAGKAPELVRPWLYRIAHNVAIDLALKRKEVLSESLPEIPVDRPDGMAPLLAAIASLTEHQRRVYVARELRGMRIDETARELGLSAGQVEQALFAARNRLAEHLVFGERLGCRTVLKLAEGPLDGQEKRALRAHVRTCTGCRVALDDRGVRLSWLPALPVGSLRDLLGWLAAGGAPTAAKVTAVVATTTFAVGIPGATHDLPFQDGTAAAASPVHTLARPTPAAAAPAVASSRLVDLTRWREATPVAAALVVTTPAKRESRDDGATAEGAAPETETGTTETTERGSPTAVPATAGEPQAPEVSDDPPEVEHETPEAGDQ